MTREHWCLRCHEWTEHRSTSQGQVCNECDHLLGPFGGKVVETEYEAAEEDVVTEQTAISAEIPSPPPEDDQ